MGVERRVFESGGQRTEHLIPGVYNRTRYERQSGGGVSANNAVIIGDSKGGEPRTVLYFNSPSEARAVLIGGNGLEGVLHAFNPGNGLVPQKIGFIRVNNGAQATTQLLKTAAAMIDLKAWDWGLHGNQVKRKFTAGTVAGSHKITMQYGTNTAEVFDNIEKKSFSVQYTGTGTASTMAIDATGITLSVDAVAAVSVPFASFPTIEDVVNYINDQTDFQATILTGDGTELASELDHVTGIAIKAAAYTAKSDLQAIIEAFRRSTYIGSSEYHAGATARSVPGYDADWVYFTGGTNGTSDTTAYTDTLEVLENEDVQIISTTSTDEAVHLLIKAHCQTMSSTTGRRERMAWVGGAVGETVDATRLRAKNINSELVRLAYPYFKDYNPINPALGVKDCSAAMYACKMLGMESSVAVNEPVTNKQVAILAWGKTLKKSEIEKLILDGVTVGAKSDDGLLITIRGVTTYQGDELQKCEGSMVREAIYMARDFRSAMKGDIGRPQTAVDAGTIRSVLQSKAVQWNSSGLIVKSVEKPLVWGVTIREDGDAVYVEYHAYLTAPRNFIFGTANLHVLSQTVAI
jgi:hypothetical protein